MKTAFPKNEHIPLSVLNLLARRKCTDFTAYYDDGVFCGISYTVCSDSTVFILYLAVSKKLRSLGYGTEILGDIKEKNEGKTLVLNVEPLDENADNYASRIRRLEFYAKNGFSDTGWYLDDFSGEYNILSAHGSFSPKDYKSAVRKLSYGMYLPEINKR